MNNKLRNSIVNHEYSRKPYISDGDYQDFMGKVPFKAVADQYKAAGIDYPESEFQQPYTDDAASDDYQGVENNWQIPGFFLPQFPEFVHGIPDITGGCRELWNRLSKNISGSPTSASVQKAIDEYSKYCPIQLMGKECCVNMKIVGPDTVASGEEASYTLINLNFSCNYEAHAQKGKITGSLSAFGTETYTAPTVSSKTKDTITVTHWFSGVECARKEITITAANCGNASIGYLTLEMNINESQELTVINPLPGASYSWTCNYGSVSPSTGNTTTFTAPSSNPNCTNNAIVSLKVGDNTCDAITIAINAYTVPGTVAYQTWERTYISGILCHANLNKYGCDGVLIVSEDHSTSSVEGPEQCYWNLEHLFEHFCDNSNWREDVVVDCRSAFLKLAGCCPKALI